MLTPNLARIPEGEMCDLHVCVGATTRPQCFLSDLEKTNFSSFQYAYQRTLPAFNTADVSICFKINTV